MAQLAARGVRLVPGAGAGALTAVPEAEGDGGDVAVRVVVAVCVRGVQALAPERVPVWGITLGLLLEPGRTCVALAHLNRCQL